MKRFRSFSLASVMMASMLPALASAQSDSSTFALNRYNPSERGSDWFANESLDLRGHQRPVLGLVGDLSHKPLVLYDIDGNEMAAIVRYQAFAHLGGGIILWDRVRAAASAPLLVCNRGDSQTTANGNLASETGTSFGDLRVGIDARIFGTYGVVAGGLPSRESVLASTPAFSVPTRSRWGLRLPIGEARGESYPLARTILRRAWRRLAARVAYETRAMACGISGGARHRLIGRGEGNLAMAVRSRGPSQRGHRLMSRPVLFRRRSFQVIKARGEGAIPKSWQAFSRLVTDAFKP